jgi:hypothetical protein
VCNSSDLRKTQRFTTNESLSVNVANHLAIGSHGSSVPPNIASRFRRNVLPKERVFSENSSRVIDSAPGISAAIPRYATHPDRSHPLSGDSSISTPQHNDLNFFISDSLPFHSKPFHGNRFL